MANIKAVGVIVFLREGKEILFLLLRAAAHGGWGPPKGKVEAGETELETATRELFEETGVRRLKFIPGFRETIYYPIIKKGKPSGKEAVFFLGEMDSDKIELSTEHTEAHLATIEELEVLIPHEDLKAVFRKAYDAVHGLK